MENRFSSFALDEERSTYTEGESKSRRSSILKPPKARAPLQEVNLGGSADDTEDFDTLRKRRVSFAGVNSVREFCSQAESLQVCHIQSYEETFSTSSDNSQNNSTKSLLQVGTPKHAVPSGEDHNYADDPMDLTDSIIDNNHVVNESAPPPVVQVIPVFTPCAQLSESVMDNRANLPSRSSRKSLAQRPVIDGNMTSSNMSISSVVGVPPLGTPRNPGAPVAVSSPWSCSMDMTEPVHVQQNRISSVNMPSNQDKIPILPFRNSFKVAEQSDHGMELTEAIPVRIRPFTINQADDNFEDMSMEMTEVVKRTELQSFRSRVSFTNESASMEFTEVVHPQKKSSQFPNFHHSSVESCTGNCGMELTEPIKAHFMSSDPSERLPSDQITSGELHSAPPQSHHVTPFSQGAENPDRDCEKSILETTSNHSLCEMEMTGVLSLSKYNKTVFNDDDADDMDFTQMLSVNGPQNKKARMSNEPDEEPFQIISPLTTKVCDVQQLLHQNKPLTSRHSNPPSVAQDELKSLAEPLASNEDTTVTATNQLDDEDTFALNFKNIRRDDDPIELPFLKEFEESPKSDKPVTKVVPGHDFTFSQNADPLNHEHFLLYSPPKHSKPDSEMKEETGLGRASMPKEPLSVGENTADLHQTMPTNINTQKRCSSNSFVFKEQQNIETLDPLRNLRNSRSFAGDVSLPPRARMSFKDFEIKADSIVANESLSTVGLDDSGILKAGLHDMTCPERVPSVSMSMTSNITSPCSKSRLSLANRTTFLRSPIQDVHQNCEQTTLAKSFQAASYHPATGKAREDHSVNRSETHDDQDTSVSVPFVFKPLPEKKKSDAHKLCQSFPILEFDESPNRPGVFLPQQRTSMGINNIPAVNKSVDPNKFVSDQDTSISMPFLFKAVTDKRSSDAYQLRQSFPIIECGESQSSDQMEFTEVAPSVAIAPRKSLARIHSYIDGNSMQPSYSSGQMELTDVVAVDRKSSCSSELTASPQDSSGIEMDETLLKIKSPDEAKAPEVFLNAPGNTEGLTTTSCDMEETNVKQKNVGNPRKSFFPSGHSPLSLTSEETITRPNCSDVAEPISKSCAGIDDEDTLAKSSLMNLDVSGKEHNSSGAIDMDMERTAVNPKIRPSLAPNNRKSFFYSLMSPDNDAAQEVLNTNHEVYANVMTELDQPKDEYCNDQRNDVEELTESAAIVAISGEHQTFRGNNLPTDANVTTGLEQFLNVGLDNPDELKSTNVKRHSNFLVAVDKPLDVFPAASLPCQKSGSGKATDAQPEDDSCVEQVIVEKSTGTVAMGISLEDTNVAVQNESTEVDIPTNAKADNQGELKSSIENRSSGFFSSGARLSCRKSGFGNATFAQPENDSRVEPLVVEKSIGTAAMGTSLGNTNLTVQNDDALTNELTEVDIPSNVPQNASPPVRLACRKSGFGMFVGSQPQDEVCDEQGNIVKISPEHTAMETSVDAKSESNAPPSVDMLESSSFHEHVDRGVSKTDTRLSRKSVHFLNSPRKEENDARCYSMNMSPEKKFEVDLAPSNGCVEMKLNSNFETGVSECPHPRRPSRKSCIGIPVDTSEDVEGESNQNTNSGDYSGEFEFAIRRSKRKSTIGTRQSGNYPDFDPRRPEDYDKMNITPLDGQPYESGIVPASESVDTESREAAEDIDLSQDMMNISLNDGELSESEAGKLNATSTPCKPRATCSTETKDPLWDRKRNRSGTARTLSLTSDLVHDLSQEMMNISIQSDTRSPLPKKLSIEPLRKSIGRPLKSRESSIGLNFHETGSNSLSFKVSENTNHLKGDLEYNTRLANRDLMRGLGFNLLGSQTCWEFLIHDKILGIKVVLPLTEFTELTRIESIDYTFYSWRIGRTIYLDRETVEFIRNRLHRHIPKEWLREECNKIGDLVKITSSLKREIELLKPLINQLHYVKSRRPCTISNDRISFKIVNLHVLVNCEVTLDLKNSHKMSDCHITVKTINGKLDLDTVRLVFQALPSSDVDVLYRFVKCLDSETSQFLARE